MNSGRCPREMFLGVRPIHDICIVIATADSPLTADPRRSPAPHGVNALDHQAITILANLPHFLSGSIVEGIPEPYAYPLRDQAPTPK